MTRIKDTFLFLIRDVRFILVILAAFSLVSIVQSRFIAEDAQDAANQAKSSNTVAAKNTRELIKIAKVNRRNGEVAKESLLLVKDCVTPGGECKARGEKQTAQAVGDISVAAIITAACSPSVDATTPRARYAQLVDCVQDLRSQVGSQSPPR